MKTFTRIFLITCFSVLFSACGGGSSDSTEPAPKKTTDGSIPPEPTPDNPTEPTPAAKSVTLSWQTPSERTNGDPLPLSEIGGYEVYYFEEGSAQGEGEILRISSADRTEVIISDLTPGTYHFAISSYDVEGIYSELSEYVTAVIPPS